MASYQTSECLAIQYMKEIKEVIIQKDFNNLGEKITVLTKHIFNYIDLIYSHINEYFEKSGIMKLLLESIGIVNQQCRRDILRFLNIFLKTNPNLRTEASNNSNFVHFLLKQLDSRDAWQSIDMKKYYINIASFLLINKPLTIKFEAEFIRTICIIVRQVLSDLDLHNFDHKKLIILIFYSSVEINAGSRSSDPNSNNDHDKVMCKDTTNFFIDTIRDYLQNFKCFYEKPNSDTYKYHMFLLKAELSFDQICYTIVYYAKTNVKLRSNLFQSGIYELLTQIFLIKNVPDLFLLKTIEVLSLPSLDKDTKERFPNQFKSCIEKLNNLRSSDNLTIKNAVESFLSNYECQSLPRYEQLGRQISRAESSLSKTQDSEFMTGRFSTWGSSDIDLWLSENNLSSFSTKLSSLTGKGLNQLTALMKEKNGRFLLIELLISKLDMDLISVLEFMGALETLNDK